MKDKIKKAAQAMYNVAATEADPYVGGDDDLSDVVLDGCFSFISFAIAAIKAIEDENDSPPGT